jgi:hypothetical protein
MARTPNWKRAGSPIGRKGPRKANPAYKRRSREPWGKEEVRELKSLAKQNTPTGVISLKLQRPLAAIRSKAQREGISLAPANRSPYTRRKSA